MKYIILCTCQINIFVPRLFKFNDFKQNKRVEYFIAQQIHISEQNINNENIYLILNQSGIYMTSHHYYNGTRPIV